MDIFKHHHTNRDGQIVSDPNHPTQAPEIQADGAVTALTVLAMVLAIIVGRKQ